MLSRSVSDLEEVLRDGWRIRNDDEDDGGCATATDVTPAAPSHSLDWTPQQWAIDIEWWMRW